MSSCTTTSFLPQYSLNHSALESTYNTSIQDSAYSSRLWRLTTRCVKSTNTRCGAQRLSTRYWTQCKIINLFDVSLGNRQLFTNSCYLSQLCGGRRDNCGRGDRGHHAEHRYDELLIADLILYIGSVGCINNIVGVTCTKILVLNDQWHKKKFTLLTL